ncbi:hypothetical protein, partial [Pengzhenrongella sp.]|uniref:hypothetical protein n=1 Tax=Pengzhenrongella sp. TaxID=2888820 RepID=UPI002F92A1B0
TKTTTIAIYPEFRPCTAPSAERILAIFATTARQHIYAQGTLIATYPPELTTLHHQVLNLFGLNPTAYTAERPDQNPRTSPRRSAERAL